jgi:hypothetical protein
MIIEEANENTEKRNHGEHREGNLQRTYRKVTTENAEKGIYKERTER